MLVSPSPRAPALLPVNPIVPAMPWSVSSWCIVRTRENLSAQHARPGSNSQIRMLGTLVAIDTNGPRYSTGASGFMSKVSRWLGPPPSQINRTDRLLASPAAAAARNAGKPSAIGTLIPAFTNARRLTPWQDPEQKLPTSIMVKRPCSRQSWFERVRPGRNMQYKGPSRSVAMRAPPSPCMTNPSASVFPYSRAFRLTASSNIKLMEPPSIPLS